MTALTAYDCFTTANDLFARGHYLDAQTLYDRACRLEPDNTVFAEAQKRLQVWVSDFFKKGKHTTTNASDASNRCSDCGEVCSEGCGDCFCEGFCDNCDCCDGCDGCNLDCCDGCDCGDCG